MKTTRSNVSSLARCPRPTRVVAAVTSVLAATAPAALAQQDSAASLEEIIVTATRRAESVRDVPYNIQAISAETLSTLGALEQSDFVRLIPGLSFIDSGARDGLLLTLRGLTTGPVLNNELGLTTTTYVDDVQVDLRTGLLDLTLLDVERVEVLRGPQGTLYGGGAIGGTIRYISKKPDLTQSEGEFGTQVSSTDHGGVNYGARGMLNLPLITDKVAVRGALGYFDNDGFIDNVRLGTRNVNWDKTLSGRVALLARPTEQLGIELTHYLQRGRFGEISIADDDLGERRVDYYNPGRETRTVQLTNLSVSYDLGFAELTSSTSYVDEKERGTDDRTTDIRDVIFPFFLPPEDIPELSEFTEERERSRTVSEEIRLVSRNTQRWDWLAGLYWFDRSSSIIQQEHVPIPFPGQTDFEDLLGIAINDDREFTFGSDPTTIQQWAVFGELGLQITPQLRLAVGARHFDYRLRETFFSIDQYFGSVDPVSGEFFPGRDENGMARTTPTPNEFNLGVADDDGQVFRFNASYAPSDTTLIYVTVAEGYRPGGFNLVTPNTGVPIDQRQYDPDSIVSYEIGGKRSFAGNRMYLSSAIYYIDWTDIQLSVPTDIGFTIFGNAGKASSKGAELELQTHGLLADGLTLGLTYSFTDAQLEQSINNLGFDGQRVPNVPRHAAGLVADYEMPLGSGWSSGLSAAATYTGESASTFGAIIPAEETGEPFADPFFLRQDAYWLVDVSARVTNENWTARVFVDNLFDDDTDLSRFLMLTDSIYRDPFTSSLLGRPRTIGLEVLRRFE